MADVYKIKYKQTVNSTPTDFKIPVNNSIWFVNPLNSNWTNAGCYAGAVADNDSLMGSKSVVNFSGWKPAENYSNMADSDISPVYASGKQNLRFVVKYGTSGFNVVRQVFNWTNLDDNLYQKITDAYQQNLSNVAQVYDPYRRDFKNIPVNGLVNSPLNVMPLNSLMIQQLVFCPFFILKEIEFYNYDSDLAGYANRSTNNVGVFTWSQVKNLDKTPAGNDYDNSLFEYGFKQITPSHSDGIKFRFVSGCVLVPYYGKCSNTYNPDTDSYVSGINPDDGKIYQNRQVLGFELNDTDDYPVINSTNLNRCCLMVLTETKSSVTGGTLYHTPTGITFSNIVPNNNTGNQDDYAIQQPYGLTSDFHKFSATSHYTPFFATENYNYNNLYKNYNPDSQTPEESPYLEIPSTAFTVNADITRIIALSGVSTAVHYYTDTINPVSFSFSKSNRNISQSLLAYFPIKSLWSTIASLGCYVADSTDTAQNAPTGKYVGNNNHIYLGYMSADGVTNGTMIQGYDISDSVQSDIDDIIQHTPYTPVNPDTPTPSGDGTDDNSHGNGNKNLPNLNAVRIGGNDGFTSFYLLSQSGVLDIQMFLSQTSSTFWQALGTATDYKFSNLIDYVCGLKWYPVSLANTGASIYPDVQTSDIAFGFSPDSKITLISQNNYRVGSLARLFQLGSVYIPYKNNQYETFLDYEPYTNVSIWLPFCGVHNLQACEAVGRTLTVDYIIDLATGMCTAFVTNGDNTLLNVTGKIGVDIPIAGNDVLTQSEKLASSYISGGTAVASSAISLAGNIASKNVLGSVQSGVNAVASIAQTSINVANAKRGVPVAVGAGSGLGATFANNKPCVIVRRPNVKIPSSYGHSNGYVFNQSALISSLSGFTVCENPDLSSIPADKEIIQDIYNILTSGFYVNH